MIKECLKVLLERDYEEPTLKPTIKNLLNNFDEDQLVYLLNNGLKISSDLVLYFYFGIGFRCYNDNAHIIGNKPICNVIEKKLNNKYKNLI